MRLRRHQYIERNHYTHTPVAGTVLDFYEIGGQYHSCNPTAVIELVTPYSKNRRTISVIDTDVPGGTGVGLVAMIEIVALMVGEVVQRYSEYRYESPLPIQIGMFIKKGVPKSMFRPGSSTVVVFFQRGRVEFCEDLVRNLLQSKVSSRFTAGFHQPLTETEIQVRSPLSRPRHRRGGATL